MFVLNLCYNGVPTKKKLQGSTGHFLKTMSKGGGEHFVLPDACTKSLSPKNFEKL
jgi:hypothetical protein